MNLFSPTILVGCVGRAVQLTAAEESGRGALQGSHGMSLGRSRGCFGWRMSSQRDATTPGKPWRPGACSHVWSLEAAHTVGKGWADSNALSWSSRAENHLKF